MSEINFLSEAEEKDEEKKEPENTPEMIEWTKPPAGQGNPGGGRLAPFSLKARADEKAERKADQMKSQRVKTGAEIKEIPVGKKRSGKFSKVWASLFKAGGGKKEGTVDFGSKKEQLAASGQVIKSEKNLRKPSAAGTNEAEGSQGRVKGEKPANKYVSYEDDRWQAPKVIKTNLIEGEAVSFVNWQGNIRGAIAGLLIAVFLIGLAYGGLLVWEMRALEKSQAITIETENLKQKIAKAESELTNINVFQKKLSQISSLLDNHIYWTNFFTFIEANVLPEVSFLGGFSGDTTGQYVLSAVADKYSRITDQVTVLNRQDQVLEASVDKGDLSVGDQEKSVAPEVTFSLKLSLDPKIFLK
ncbi:MAG: hypothetical protein MUC28_01735 [Planctomycetes bacterium]|jgi:hypothetical protein|nr:hypothetical protein [Planctomycetota bacterium]